jgi:hypothetical protein
VGGFDTLLSWSWLWILGAGPVVNGVGICTCGDGVATGALVFAVKRSRWSSIAKRTCGAPLGWSLGLLIGDGALTGRTFSTPGSWEVGRSTALPLMDASSIGPLNEGLGLGLEGRLKYFLRLLRWSLLCTAAGSGEGPSDPTPFSGASSEVLGIGSSPGPGSGQLTSPFGSSSERGFLGLPHFWHEGPHFPRRNADSG